MWTASVSAVALAAGPPDRGESRAGEPGVAARAGVGRIAAAGPDRRGVDDRHRRRCPRNTASPAPGCVASVGRSRSPSVAGPRPPSSRRSATTSTGSRTAGAKIGLIQDAPGDVGLTGDAWYGTGPVRDRTLASGRISATQVASFLTKGWGADETPDLLAVPMSRSVVGDDRTTGQIVDEVLAKVPDATIVVAGTGTLRPDGAAGTPSDPDGIVPTPGGAPAGGFFVDREPGSTATAQDVVDAMRGQRDGSRTRVRRRVRGLRGAVRKVLLMALETDLRADPQPEARRARPHVGVGAADARRGWRSPRASSIRCRSRGFGTC